MSIRWDRTGLDELLQGAGENLALLERTARSVVLFGSRASGRHHGRSDWDILVVDGPRLEFVERVDVVAVRSADRATARWRACDLSSHVAAFGVTIAGDSLRWDLDYDRAASQKEKAVKLRSRRMVEYWPVLSGYHHARHIALLRRELQRYVVLKSARPAPPTAMLDARWVKQAEECLSAETVLGVDHALLRSISDHHGALVSESLSTLTSTNDPEEALP